MVLIFVLQILNPQVSWIVIAGGPRVTGKMTDHPAIVHGEARCGALGMVLAGSDVSRASVGDLIGILTDKAGSEAFGTFIPVIIHFRLRMAVRRVA